MLSSRLSRVLEPAWRGALAHWRAGLVLQLFALALVLSYFQSSAVSETLNAVGHLKADWGYSYSMASTALFGGAIPFAVLCLTGRIPARQRGAQLVFYLAFWAWKGVEIDALYRAQALLFGESANIAVIASKTALDQFVYNPLWGAPTQAWFFLWKDSGFSRRSLGLALKQQALSSRIVVILVSTWVVWIPAVAIIYALPSALQIPLFNLVLCFWCLLLSFVSRSAEGTTPRVAQT